MTPRSLRVVALVFVAALAVPRARAWNDTGHRLSALVAFARMNVETRSRAVEILRAHPRFEEDFLGRKPPGFDELAEADRERWFFTQAATWPDIARGFDGALRDEYHRSTWHYVNFPVFLSDEDEAAFAAGVPAHLSEDWGDGTPAGRRNVLQALAQSLDVLGRRDVPDATKAVALCWFLHLAGDLHQPLHSAALFSRQRFPEGDRGGNSIRTTRDGNLHATWDRWLGTADDLGALSAAATNAAADREVLAAAARDAADPRFSAWCDESHDLAQDVVYGAEVLAAVRQADADGKPEVEVALSPEYEQRARTLARQRVALSGIRIARALEGLDGF